VQTLRPKENIWPVFFCKNKNNAAQNGAQICHQPKGAARIENMGDVKEAFYDRYGLVKRQITQDECFSELIQQNDHPADNHQFDIFVFQHLFISKGSEVLRSGFKVFSAADSGLWRLAAATGHWQLQRAA
jgi:hypothetical protein